MSPSKELQPLCYEHLTDMMLNGQGTSDLFLLTNTRRRKSQPHVAGVPLL